MIRPISKFLLIGLFLCSTAFAEMPDPPIKYLMDKWNMNAPGAPPGEAILYYDLPPFFDGVPDLVLAFTVESFSIRSCIPKQIMTEDKIFLNTDCDTKKPIVYILKRPHFAVRGCRLCEKYNLRMGWLFAGGKNKKGKRALPP